MPPAKIMQTRAAAQVRLPSLHRIQGGRDAWVHELWDTGLVDTQDIAEMLGIQQPEVVRVLAAPYPVDAGREARG